MNTVFDLYGVFFYTWAILVVVLGFLKLFLRSFNKF